MPGSKDSGVVSGQTFWQLYLQEHQHPVNRWLHAGGTCVSWIVVAYAVWCRSFWWLLLAPVAGYLLAWSGHAFVERNRPLSIKYPLQSFIADYRLTLMMILGRNPAPTKSETTSQQDRH